MAVGVWRWSHEEASDETAAACLRHGYGPGGGSNKAGLLHGACGPRPAQLPKIAAATPPSVRSFVMHRRRRHDGFDRRRRCELSQPVLLRQCCLPRDGVRLFSVVVAGVVHDAQRHGRATRRARISDCQSHSVIAGCTTHWGFRWRATCTAPKPSERREGGPAPELFPVCGDAERGLEPRNDTCSLPTTTGSTTGSMVTTTFSRNSVEGWIDAAKRDWWGPVPMERGLAGLLSNKMREALQKDDGSVAHDEKHVTSGRSGAGFGGAPEILVLALESTGDQCRDEAFNTFSGGRRSTRPSRTWRVSSPPSFVVIQTTRIT